MAYIGKVPSPVPMDASDIPANSIDNTKIVDGAITIADIADDAVTEAKLANAINSAIAANTAKTGITSAQASAITANTAKVTNSTNASDLASGTVAAARLSTAATQLESDDSTKIATTAYVVDKITTLIGGAPSTLNDLNELAAAINDDANYNSTLTTALATKLPLAGGTMSGDLDVQANITADQFIMGDNQKIKLGNAGDLEMYHNAGDSYIADVGDGGIKILTAGVNDSGFYKVGGEKLATFEPDAAVTLYHNNAVKFATTAAGATVTGNLAVTGDVTSSTFLSATNGLTNLNRNHSTTTAALAVLDLKATSTGDMADGFGTSIRYQIQDTAGVENTVAEINAVRAGSDTVANLELQTADVTRLKVGAVGIDVTGNLQMGGTNIINSGLAMYNLESFKMADTKKAYFGSSNDLEIYHDGANSYINDTGTGSLIIKSSSPRMQDAGGKLLLVGDTDAGVALYYNAAGKLTTTNTGVTVTGTVTATSFTGSGSGLTGLISTLSGLTDSTVSSSDPVATSNPSAVGHLWVQSTSGEAYICTDATTNQNDWTNIGAGTGDVNYFVPVTSLMLIGGGGGGAGDLRGGAGAGGLLFFTGFQGTLAYNTSYTITVGSGGTAPNASTSGGDGNNSTAFGETAGGGGGGGTGSANTNAGGDSGSVNIAASSSNYTTGNGYGNVGGSNGGNPGAGGGGAGGAAANMASGNRAGGDGGAGKQFANIYNGSDNYYWAGGGGGPGYGNTEDGGDGGIGGGGGGGVYSEGSPTGTLSTGGGSALDNGDAGGNQNNSNNGGDGGTNTGAGAGSGSHRGGGQTSSTGGPGGSGIVCIKMPDSTTDATTSGTVVKTTTGGYKYYAFTSSGTITFNT